MMPDQILTASSPDEGFAVIAGITTELVREAQSRHVLSPTASAAVGRLLTGAVLLATNLKGSERISLQIQGDGPIGGLTADAWLIERDVVGARGSARNPRADIPLNERGKFDVAGVIGQGALQVTKSFEIGQPYAGVVPLYSGEIAEDIASYLVNSEQIPSVVALGVLANPDGISCAGGIVAQVLPGADDAAIASLERRALSLPPVTRLIADGADAHRLLHAIAGGAGMRAHRTLDIRFACRCTREKVETALLGLGVDQLRNVSRERDETEATCEFCKKTYVFTRSEVAELASRLETVE